jgi:hypothetical protein
MVIEPSWLVTERVYRYSGLELLMGELDDISDAQLQSWIGVTEATIEAEMKYVKFLVEETGLPKDFAGRVGAMAKHIEVIEALREMLNELKAEVSRRARQL